MDNEQTGSIQLLHDVVLRTKQPIELGGRLFDANEVVLYFDTIQMMAANTNLKTKLAHGGFGDRDLVEWDELNKISLAFTNGTFSPASLSLLLNAKMVTSQEEQVLVSYQETVETNSLGVAQVSHNPVTDVFCYEVSTGNKITDFTYSDNKIYFDSSFTYKDVMVNYRFEATNSIDLI